MHIPSTSIPEWSSECNQNRRRVQQGFDLAQLDWILLLQITTVVQGKGCAFQHHEDTRQVIHEFLH